MSLLLVPLIDIILGYSTRQLNILNLKLLKIQSCLCCWYVLFIVDPCNNTVVFVVMSYVRISYRLRLRFKIHRISVSTALISFVAILRWSQGRLNCPGLGNSKMRDDHWYRSLTVDHTIIGYKLMNQVLHLGFTHIGWKTPIWVISDWSILWSALIPDQRMIQIRNRQGWQWWRMTDDINQTMSDNRSPTMINL